jgi:O-Antigen ligase
MTAVDHPSQAPVASVGGRLIAAAAFSLPPLMLLVVGLGLALRGGGVAPQQWQPVAVGLAASLLVLSAVGAVPRVPRAALPTIAALGGLLAWSALSFLWTDSREQTFEQVIRLSMLAAAMLVGIAYVARPRAALALAVGLASCGAVAAGAIEVDLLRGTTSAFSGARLSWPIDYANAAAAFVWLPLPALLAFAAAAPPRPLVRGAIGAFAGLGLAVGLATQSRGAAIALACALVASVAIARDRSRYGLTLLVVMAPVAAVASRIVGGDPSSSASMVRDRGYAALTAAVVAGVLVCGLAMVDRRSRFPFGGRETHAAVAAWAVVLALGIGAFVSANGRPDTWISARWNEFTHVQVTATQPTDATHFGTGTSNRYDYWRVAWHSFEDHPLQGVGAGAFSVPWFRSRSIDENVSDAHSWQANALADRPRAPRAGAAATARGDPNGANELRRVADRRRGPGQRRRLLRTARLHRLALPDPRDRDPGLRRPRRAGHRRLGWGVESVWPRATRRTCGHGPRGGGGLRARLPLDLSGSESRVGVCNFARKRDGRPQDGRPTQPVLSRATRTSHNDTRVDEEIPASVGGRARRR